MQARNQQRRQTFPANAPLPVQELNPGDRIEVVTVYSLKGK